MEEKLKDIKCSACGKTSTLVEYELINNELVLAKNKKETSGIRHFVCKNCYHVETYWFGACQLIKENELEIDAIDKINALLNDVNEKINEKAIYWYDLIFNVIEAKILELKDKNHPEYENCYKSFYECQQDKNGKWLDRRYCISEDILQEIVKIYPFIFDGLNTYIDKHISDTNWGSPISTLFMERHKKEALEYKELKLAMRNFILARKTKHDYPVTIKNDTDGTVFNKYVKYQALAMMENKRENALETCDRYINSYKELGIDISSEMTKVKNTIDKDTIPEF